MFMSFGVFRKERPRWQRPAGPGDSRELSQGTTIGRAGITGLAGYSAAPDSSSFGRSGWISGPLLPTPPLSSEVGIRWGALDA